MFFEEFNENTDEDIFSNNFLNEYDDLKDNLNENNKNEYVESELNENNVNEDTEVHISTSLSSTKIVEIIEDYPNLKKITCPKSLYNRISEKYLDALDELGISVEIKYNWGKPPKYSEECPKKVVELIKNGYSLKEIAEKLDISIKTVYYLKNKNKNEKITLKRGKKRKYSYELREAIRKSYRNGISVRTISKKENIPIRTIYDIINED